MELEEPVPVCVPLGVPVCVPLGEAEAVPVLVLLAVPVCVLLGVPVALKDGVPDAVLLAVRCLSACRSRYLWQWTTLCHNSALQVAGLRPYPIRPTLAANCSLAPYAALLPTQRRWRRGRLYAPTPVGRIARPWI